VPMSTIAWPRRDSVHAMSWLMVGITIVTLAAALAALTWPSGNPRQARPAKFTATPTETQAYADFFMRRWPLLVRLAAASDTLCFTHPTLIHRRQRSAPVDVNQPLHLGSCLAALRREDRATRSFLGDLSGQPVANEFATTTTRFASAVRANLLINMQLAADLSRGDVARYNRDVRSHMPPRICIGPINHLIGSGKPSQQLPQAIFTNC
jgi:hypothetical protein